MFKSNGNFNGSLHHRKFQEQRSKGFSCWCAFFPIKECLSNPWMKRREMSEFHHHQNNNYLLKPNAEKYIFRLLLPGIIYKMIKIVSFTIFNRQRLLISEQVFLINRTLISFFFTHKFSMNARRKRTKIPPQKIVRTMLLGFILIGNVNVNVEWSTSSVGMKWVMTVINWNKHTLETPQLSFTLFACLLLAFLHSQPKRKAFF